MYIYLILIAAIFIVPYLLKLKINDDKKVKIIYISIMSVFIFLIFALRSINVGVDTPAYHRIFNEISKIEFNNLDAYYMEYGFVFMTKLLTLISSNPQVLIVVSSFIIVSSFMWFIYKYSDNIQTSLLVFILLLYAFTYMNIMRQALATSILLFGFPYLIEDENKIISKLKYVIIVAVASLFHTVAWVALPLVLLSYVKLNKKRIIIVLVAALSVFVLADYIIKLAIMIFPNYSGYLDSIYGKPNYFGAIFDLAFFLFIGIILILKTDFENLNKKQTVLIYIFIIHIVMQIMMIKMTAFHRVAQVFSTFLILTIPMMQEKEIESFEIRSLYQFDDLLSKKNNKLFYLVMVASVAYFITISVFRPEWHGAIHYEFFF